MMSDTHRDVARALQSVERIETGDAAGRVDALEEVASALDAALSDNAG